MAESWENLDKREIPGWFEEARFGIFIHWGPYSVPAYRAVNEEQFGSYAEWYYASVYGEYRNSGDGFHKRVYSDDVEYRDFGKWFKAELFDPDYLAGLISDSGAKYAVLTTKHHDGYCMWPTKNPHKALWNTGETGPMRDITGELGQALIKRGVEFGIYYSIIDWESVPSHRCDGGYFIPEKDVKKYGLSREVYLEEVLKTQLYELVNTYKPSVIYSDGGEWDLTEEESHVRPFLSWLYNESPVKDKVVVNDRFYKEMPGCHGDYYSTEYQDKEVEKHPFEESRGVGKSYGYNRAERLCDYLTSKELISELVRVVTKGGNFLLNIGPMADGTIPVHEEERLREIGAWLKDCGEAVYGTKPCEMSGQELYPSTCRDSHKYIFLGQEEIDVCIRNQREIDVCDRNQRETDVCNRNQEEIDVWDRSQEEEKGICRLRIQVHKPEEIKRIDMPGVEEECCFLVGKDAAIIEVDDLGRLFRYLERFGKIVVKITEKESKESKRLIEEDNE